MSLYHLPGSFSSFSCTASVLSGASREASERAESTVTGGEAESPTRQADGRETTERDSETEE